MSQSGGSNRGGFRIVFSNSKHGVHLNGVFNIISYDVVPKIQNVLLSSDFKVYGAFGFAFPVTAIDLPLSFVLSRVWIL